MDIVSRFVNSLIGEPRKSRIQAGIVDNNGIPTSDGIKIVIAYLLDKGDIDGFDKNVVKSILKEKEV